MASAFIRPLGLQLALTVHGDEQWVIPEIGKFSAEPTDHVPNLVYPHFTTSMVHRDYVDWYAS